MSHVFILTATNHRVPRWFTEGLAVHEEGKRSPEWSNRATPDVLIAIRDKKLLPVAELDRGFVYPEYPAQVIVSYFQAGSICDFVQEKWGEDKLLDMVHSLRACRPRRRRSSRISACPPEQFDQAVSRVDRPEVWRGGRALRRMAGQAEGAGCRGGSRSSTTRCCSRGRQ